MMEYTIIHNEEEQHFELAENPNAYVEYIYEEEKIIFTSTEVPKELEGKGIGSSLVKFALDYARENNWEYIPECPFFKAYIERHPEYKP